MTRRPRGLLIIGLAIGLGLGGCALLERATQSPEYRQFCSWAPVATKAIRAAAAEALLDPAKQRAGEALLNAAMYLQVAASQCPSPTE